MVIKEEPEWAFVTAADRCALLRHGLVVVGDGVWSGDRYVEVVSPRGERALALAREHFAADVEVMVVGETHRQLRPRTSVGHMEREPGRLQVRYVLASEEHMDEILVEEDDETVVVYALVCEPMMRRSATGCGQPFHVYLESPLADRTVIDGVTGEPVPYRNVYDELVAKKLAVAPDDDQATGLS